MKNIRFNFEIDREAYFWYWVQSLVQWSWYFEKEEFNFYESELPNNYLHDKKGCLNKFKKILQKKDNGFLWLWERYLHKPIRFSEKYTCYLIRKEMETDFNIFWERELPLLKKWKESMEEINFNILHNFNNKVITFLDINKKNSAKVIQVKLFPYHNEKFPAGHSHKLFRNLILLNISHLNRGFENRAIGVVAHEYIHTLIEDESKLNNCLKKSFENIILPSGIQKITPGWKHLLIETVVTSLAGKRDENYLNYTLQIEKMNDPLAETINIKKELSNHGFLIRVAAFRILNETITYMENNKQIDQNYCDKIAKIWVEFYS